VANQRFQRCKNEFSITFDFSTQINPADDDMSIQTRKLGDITLLEEIPNKEVGENVDVVVIVMAVGAADEIRLKSGEMKNRRNITFIDHSNHSIEMTLWGDQATNFKPVEGDIVAVRGARIGEFNGKNLSSSFTTTIMTSVPPHPNLQKLQQFKNQKGGNYSDCSKISSGGG